MNLLLHLLIATLSTLSLAFTGTALAHESVPKKEPVHEHEFEARKLTEDLRQPGVATHEKAQRRKELLKELAESLPSAVIDLALTPIERANLPDNVQTSVETWEEQTGELQVIHIDYEDGHSKYDIALVEGNQRVPLRIGRSANSVKPGDRVKVTGVKLAGDDVLVTAETILIAASQAPAIPVGPQRTAVILASAPGAPPHPYANKTNTASIIYSTSNPQSARAFYLQASYGQTAIVGGDGLEGTAADIYGPYTVTTPCGGNTSGVLTAADPDLDFNRYSRILILYNAPNCSTSGIAGYGSVGSLTLGVFDGALQYGSTAGVFNVNGDTAFNSKIGPAALHEFGHNLGLMHANTLECGLFAIGGSSCTSTEYGDASDVMGKASGYGHPNGVHKDTLTWLGSGRSQIANATGQYTINAYEDGIANTKVLKIPRTRDSNGNVIGYYYLETRRPTTAWNSFALSRPNYAQGVLVHTAGLGAGGDSVLIDSKPYSSPQDGFDWNDAPVLSGESYTDAAAGVSFQVTATTATSATVQVTLSAPKVSAQTWVYPEGTGTVIGGGSFNAGDSVTLTAVPNAGYSLLYWGESASFQPFPNPYTFTITGDRQLSAVFTDAVPTNAVPANDNFETASSVTVPAYTQLYTSYASIQQGEPVAFDSSCGSRASSVGKTVWYRVTVPVATTLLVNTQSSNFDTVLSVYTGSSLNNLTRVGCTDNGYLPLSAAPGITYHIQVGGFAGAGGKLVFSVTELFPFPTTSPLVIGVVSRKTHGAAGPFDLALSRDLTNPTTEPRAGSSHRLVFRFHKTVIAGGASVDYGIATAAAPIFNGNEMIVDLSNVPDKQYVVVAVSAVPNDGGALGGDFIRIGFLAGDVNGSRTVTLSDMLLVNSVLARSVTSMNFLSDVNASGTLTLSDLLVTNANLTHVLPAP